MTRRKLLLAGGPLAALLALLLIFNRGAEQPDRLAPPRPRPVAKSRSEGEPGQQPDSTERRKTPRAKLAPGPAAHRGIHGRVITPDGEPAVGAVVSAFRVRHDPAAALVPFPRNPFEGRPAAARVTTDRAGWFQLVPPAGVYRLTAAHRRGQAPLGEPLALRSGGSLGPLTLVLQPLFPLAGRVVDPEGRPVPGAWLVLLASNDREVPPRRGKSDAAGRFRFEVPAGRHALRVTASGYVPLLYPELPAPRRDLRLVLQRGGAIAGQVVDRQTGAPVAGARIEGVLGDWNQTATSDGEGRFRFEQAPPGEALLSVTHADYAPAQHAARTRRGAALELVIRLRSGLLLEGTVVLRASGDPLAGVTVVARPLEAAVVSEPQARTDESGRFRLGGLHKGAWTLWLLAPGHTLAAPREVFVHANRKNRVALQAVAAATIDGAVTDHQDSPLAGARVRIAPGGEGAEAPWLLGGATTDAQGAFRLVVPLVGRPFQLDIEHPEQVGIYFGPLQLGAGERKTVRIRMPEAGAVAGRVAGAAGPAPGALLTLFSLADDGARARVARAPADGQGAYHFGKLHPGTTYQLRAEAAGLQTSVTEPFRVAAGQVLTLDLRLPAGQALAGTVLTPDGAPVVGALVEAVDQPSGGFLGRARSDEAGRFRFDNLSPGPYALSAFAPGHREATLADVQAGAAPSIELARERTISVEVELPDDYHFDYKIALYPAGRPQQELQPVLARQYPPTQRRHTLGPLPEGRYRLVAGGPGLVPLTLDGVDATAEGGSVQYLQLRMGRMIVGKLVDARTGQPINGAMILRGRVAPTVSASEAQARGLVLEATHPDGDFHLTGFEGPRATVTVMHPEYLTRTATVQVGEAAVNKLALEPGHSLRIELASRGKRGGRELRLEGPVVRQAATDESGVARFAGLLPGEYKVLIDGQPARHGAIRVPETTAVRLED